MTAEPVLVPETSHQVNVQKKHQSPATNEQKLV